MKIFEVTQKGDLVDATLPKLRNIVAAVEFNEGEQAISLSFQTSWKTVFENDPDTGHMMVSVVVPAGSHPDWDDGLIVNTILKSACEKIGKVFGELLGSDTGYDISQTRVRVINEGGGTNIEKSDVIDFFQAVKDGTMAEKIIDEKAVDDRFIDDYVPDAPIRSNAPLDVGAPSTPAPPISENPEPSQTPPSARSTPERSRSRGI